MSLRWRIMGLTVSVVAITVLVSVSVGYYATQARLGVFVDQIGDDEATRLARNLSREYTSSGGWETTERALSEAGYVSGGVPQVERQGERSEGSGEESSELFHQDRIRVVIVGMDGRVVEDNLSDLPPGAVAPDLGGRHGTVFDLTTDQPVGNVYVDVNREFLATESHGFLSALLYITVIGGLLTVGVAILLAAWLSKRITGACGRADGGDTGDFPRGCGPSAGYVLGRAGTDERGVQPYDLRPANPARAPPPADKRRLA